MKTKFPICLATVMVAFLTGCSADPLSIAATGVTTSVVLDRAAEKANILLGQAAASASLVTSKTARDLELLVSASRQQLHGELDHQWDRLGDEKISILREIDRTITRLEGAGTGVSRMQDQIFLDIEGAVSRLPFAESTPVIRKVEGGSQYIRPNGLYRVVLTTSLPPLAKGDLTVRIAGKPIPAASINFAPPYALAVNIPAKLLESQFSKDSLVYIPLEVSAEVSADRGWRLWKAATRTATLRTTIELFPINAVTYRLTEWTSVPTVDLNNPQVQPGPDVTIAGCGNSGCNTYHPHCVGAPPGAQPIDAINHRDSFAGWGGWGGASVQGTQVCATYWQHSHNRARNVGFDIRYYPAITVTQPIAVALRKLDVAQDPKMSSTPATGPSAVEIGRTYSADFSPRFASYELVVRMFTGETTVATPALAPSGGLLIVTPTEREGGMRRMAVTFRLPW